MPPKRILLSEGELEAIHADADAALSRVNTASERAEVASARADGLQRALQESVDAQGKDRVIYLDEMDDIDRGLVRDLMRVNLDEYQAIVVGMLVGAAPEERRDRVVARKALERGHSMADAVRVVLRNPAASADDIRDTKEKQLVLRVRNDLRQELETQRSVATEKLASLSRADPSTSAFLQAMAMMMGKSPEWIRDFAQATLALQLQRVSELLEAMKE